MTGDCHVRFCEGLGVKLPRATRPSAGAADLFDDIQPTDLAEQDKNDREASDR